MAIGDHSGSIVLINNLDTGNPLHIQTNDNSSTNLNLFKLLDTENYRIWTNDIKLTLQARNKFSFGDGTCLKASYDTSDVLFVPRDRCNAIVLTWIMNSFYQDAYMGLVYYDNANSVWKELESTYDKLMKLMQFLIGLDDYYHSIRSALLTEDPLPEVKDAYIIVSREKYHRGIPESSVLKSLWDHPNGTLATISHVGNLKFSNNVILYDVLVAFEYYVKQEDEGDHKRYNGPDFKAREDDGEHTEPKDFKAQ
nr:hypothetical protein [Tanacetum cinerariifolium]